MDSVPLKGQCNPGHHMAVIGEDKMVWDEVMLRLGRGSGLGLMRRRLGLGDWLVLVLVAGEGEENTLGEGMMFS
jgi:hypothetical protein